MKITVQKLPKSEVKLVIALDDEELASYREKAAETLGQRVSVPGFRNGKAPAFQIEAHVGKQTFFQEVLRFAIPMSYSKAVQQEKVLAISRPKITLKTEYPLEYEAVVALQPEISIKGYEKVKIPAEKTDVSDKEHEEVIQEMRRYHATFQPRTETIQKGDKAEIDFEGFDEKGTSVPNTKSKNHPLFVGEGTLVPGFEEQLVGMKVLEKKKFPVTFPKDFHYESLRGKSVTFEVEVKSAHEPLLPAFDEAFVEKVYGKKLPVDEFQKLIRADVEMQKKRDAKRKREDKLIEKWVDMAKVDISDVLVDDEIDYLVDQMKADLEKKGLKFEQYMEFLKSKGRDLRKEKEEEAKKRLKIRLALGEIMRLENIQASKEEVEAAFENLLKNYSAEEQAKIRESAQKDRFQLVQIENNLRLDKLFDRFLA